MNERCLMKNKLMFLGIPFFFLFYSCTYPDLEYRSRYVSISTDSKSYECNQRITIFISRNFSNIKGESAGVFSVFKKNENSSYFIYPTYTFSSDDFGTDCFFKSENSCVFLTNLTDLRQKKKFYFSIPDSGDYRITLTFSAPEQWDNSTYMKYGEQYYVDFSVSD